jgi:hypothetical protein
MNALATSGKSSGSKRASDAFVLLEPDRVRASSGRCDVDATTAAALPFVVVIAAFEIVFGGFTYDFTRLFELRD